MVWREMSRRQQEQQQEQQQRQKATPPPSVEAEASKTGEGNVEEGTIS